jgi:hypothetical protein
MREGKTKPGPTRSLSQSYQLWPRLHALARLAVAVLCLYLTSCSSDKIAATGTWRASVDHGDKPGIGIELTRGASTVTSRMFLLEPNRPHDFSAGSPRLMRILEASEKVIRFDVEWKPGVRSEMVLKLSEPLQGRRVRGTLEETNGSGAPEEFLFLRK